MKSKTAFAALLLAISLASSANATPNEDAASAAVKRGLEAFAHNDPATALKEYLKAQELVPDANLPYRYAAEAYVALGQDENAIASLQKYLEKNPAVSDADLVRTRIEQLKAKTLVEVSISTTPEGATVYVDGSPTPSGTTPISSLHLRAGEHTFSFEHSHLRSMRVQQTISNTNKLVRAVLDEGMSQRTPSPPRAEHAPSSSSSTRTVGWIVLGSGAGIFATSFLLDAAVLRPTIDEYDGARATDIEHARSLHSKIRTWQTTLLLSYGVGVAAMAVGGGLVLFGDSKKSATVSVVPSGVFVRGAF